MRIIVHVLKDRLLRESQVTRRAAQIRGEQEVGYHKSLRLANKEVSDVDHTVSINVQPGKEINVDKIAAHLAEGRDYRVISDSE